VSREDVLVEALEALQRDCAEVREDMAATVKRGRRVPGLFELEKCPGVLAHLEYLTASTLAAARATPQTPVVDPLRETRGVKLTTPGDASREDWDEAEKHARYRDKYPRGVNCPCKSCNLSRPKSSATPVVDPGVCTACGDGQLEFTHETDGKVPCPDCGRRPRASTGRAVRTAREVAHEARFSCEGGIHSGQCDLITAAIERDRAHLETPAKPGGDLVAALLAVECPGCNAAIGADCTDYEYSNLPSFCATRIHAIAAHLETPGADAVDVEAFATDLTRALGLFQKGSVAYHAVVGCMNELLARSTGK
jgi:ribosomal protein S27E